MDIDKLVHELKLLKQEQGSISNDRNSYTIRSFKGVLEDQLRSTIGGRKFGKMDIFLYDEDDEDLLMLEINPSAKSEANVIQNIHEGLLSSICSGDNKRFQLLANSKVRFDFTQFLSGTQKTLLHVACERGRYQIVKQLIERHKVPVNIRFFDYKNNLTGMTPLHSAVMYDRSNIIRYLLKKGAKKKIAYRGITCEKLMKTKKKLRNVDRLCLTDLRKILRGLKKKGRFLLNSRDLKNVFRRIGQLKFEKIAKRKGLACVMLNKKNKASISKEDEDKTFEKREMKRRKTFELKTRVKEIGKVNGELETENLRLKEMLKKYVGEIESTKMAEKGTQMGSEIPKMQVVKKIPEFLKKSIINEPNVKVEQGIMDLKRIAEAERVIRKKKICSRRLKAALKSTDFRFLQKLLAEMKRQCNGDFDVSELLEYVAVEKKLQDWEDECKKIEKEVMEKEYEKYSPFSVPPECKSEDVVGTKFEDPMKRSIMRTTLRGIKDTEEEDMEDEIKTPEKVTVGNGKMRGMDDIMITSVYAIENAVKCETVSPHEDDDDDSDEEFVIIDDFDMI